MDLYCAIDEEQTLKFGERLLIPTGVSIELPEGYEAQIRPRSGLALKHGLTILNAPSTIDSDYRGEVFVLLINLGTENFILRPGMRVAQMVVASFARVNWVSVSDLSPTERGSGGFGHTGV